MKKKDLKFLGVILAGAGVLLGFASDIIKDKQSEQEMHETIEKEVTKLLESKKEDTKNE